MPSTPPPDAYSQIADNQLNKLERGKDAGLYNQIINVCEQIFDDPEQIRKFSTIISTTDGTRFCTPVPGKEPQKVFWSWSPEGFTRIEANFPYPTS